MIVNEQFNETLSRSIEEAKSRPFTRPEGIHRKRLITMVCKLMDWDRERAKLWFSTENPNLGNVSPDVLIKLGRGHKVEAFIKSAQKESVL